VSLPGTVLDYDASDNTASIELQITDPVEDDDGNLTHESYPTLIGVPIVFPRAKNAFFPWEVEAGARVAVVFCSQAIDQWLTSGLKSNPGDLRTHSLSHAYALPGLYPMTEPVASGDRQTNGCAVGIPGGLQARFTSSEIKLGKNATHFVADAHKVDAELTDIATAIGTLATALSITPSPYIFTTPQSVACSKVKAE
jgi:hypothetical protein